MSKHAASAPPPVPVCLAAPQPGDIVCIPVSGAMGIGIEVGQYLAARMQGFPAELLPYDHAEVYVGQADAHGPHGYTYSAYPNDGTGTTTGKRALPCPPAQLPGSIWSSGLYDPTPAQRSAIVGWCVAHPDVQYSWADYGAIAAHAMHLPLPGLKTYIAGTSHMICSYYSDASWAQAGMHLFTDGRWPGYVTPWDLAELFLAQAHVKKLTAEE